ncbi:hypothetical protein SBD_0842 [Streptomyces bottropensis ATCC 25435]|uniref:Uncharacterized protein n=1 Tax=Streptomyces bottropensis ATCC 25435 TaxID=1054862 RepID=M3FYK5_9ACTN|nr:hypothetical protein SBD_0842 [Streptomyces bottropensis ATCC 25435]
MLERGHDHAPFFRRPLSATPSSFQRAPGPPERQFRASWPGWGLLPPTSGTGTGSCRFSTGRAADTRKPGGAARAPPGSRSVARRAKGLESFGVNEKEAPPWPRRGQR